MISYPSNRQNFKNTITPSIVKPQSISYTHGEHPGTTTLANSYDRLVRLTMYILCDSAIPLQVYTLEKL